MSGRNLEEIINKCQFLCSACVWYFQTKLNKFTSCFFFHFNEKCNRKEKNTQRETPRGRYSPTLNTVTQAKSPFWDIEVSIKKSTFILSLYRLSLALTNIIRMRSSTTWDLHVPSESWGWRPSIPALRNSKTAGEWWRWRHRFLNNSLLPLIHLWFTSISSWRLVDETFTVDEVKEMLDGLQVVVRGEVEMELINTAHTNVLLLRQLFSQAEKFYLRLQSDISELENRWVQEMFGLLV